MKSENLIKTIQAGWPPDKAPKSVTQRNDVIMSIAANVLPMFPRFEQIAFYTDNMAQTKRQYAALGCRAWVDDTVTAAGLIGTEIEKRDAADTINVASLAFNYDLGTELELIKYEAGFNWHAYKGRVEENGSCRAPFLSHMSYHVDSVAEECKKFQRAGFKLVQKVHTISHTSPDLVKSGRKYIYAIFDTAGLLGFDIKLIQRVERNSIQL